jgi:hypothetical protein
LRHRNECVFNGKSPHQASALVMAGEDSLRWGLAGARGLAQLANHEPLAGQSMAKGLVVAVFLCGAGASASCILVCA